MSNPKLFISKQLNYAYCISVFTDSFSLLPIIGALSSTQDAFHFAQTFQRHAIIALLILMEWNCHHGHLVLLRLFSASLLSLIGQVDSDTFDLRPIAEIHRSQYIEPMVKKDCNSVRPS